jgi:hypothetical protein
MVQVDIVGNLERGIEVRFHGYDQACVADLFSRLHRKHSYVRAYIDEYRPWPQKIAEGLQFRLNRIAENVDSATTPADTQRVSFSGVLRTWIRQPPPAIIPVAALSRFRYFL